MGDTRRHHLQPTMPHGYAVWVVLHDIERTLLEVP